MEGGQEILKFRGGHIWMVSYYKLQLSLTMLIMYDTRFIGVGLMASTIRLNHVVYSSFLEGKIDKSICTCAKSLICL